MMTPAERHDWLVQQGAERYADVYLAGMKFMAQKGRTPGLTLPSREELLALYQQTNDAYWQNLNAQDPDEAQSQLKQFQQVEG